jgi:hypothetical protein
MKTMPVRYSAGDQDRRPGFDGRHSDPDFFHAAAIGG